MVTILWTCSSGDHVGRREKAQFRATHPPGKKHHQARSGPHRGLRPVVTGEAGRTHAARPQGTAPDTGKQTCKDTHRYQHTHVCTRRLSLPPAPSRWATWPLRPRPRGSLGIREWERQQTALHFLTAPPWAPVASSARLGGSPARGRALLPPPNSPHFTQQMEAVRTCTHTLP